MTFTILVILAINIGPLSGQTTDSPVHSPELIIRDLFYSAPNADRESAWNPSGWIGDPDRDGRTSFLSLEVRKYPGPPYGEHIPWVSSGSDNHIIAGPNTDSGARISLGGLWERRSGVILKTPAGFRLLANDNHFPGPLSVWEISTGKHLAFVLPPPAPPGLPQTEWFGHLVWAGDLNLDGWDDAFYQSFAKNGQSYGTTGLIDGKSLTVLWQHYLPGFSTFSPVQFGEAQEWPDLNGDGIIDYLSAFQTSYFTHTITALSGLDGSVLWTTQHRATDWIQHASLVPDLNADGVPDIVKGAHPAPSVSDPGFIAAISGVDGQTLWEVPGTVLEGVVPAGTEYHFRHPIFFSRRPGEPEEPLLFMTTEIWHQPGPFEDVFVMIDGRDGSNLGLVNLPEDLQPWLPDGFSNKDVFQSHWLLGDIDGDGCQEIGRRLQLPAHDSPLTTMVPGCMVILGLRTLLIPEEAQLGAVVEATISIPSGVDKDFQLLLSTGFRRRPASPRVDGWSTMLAVTPLLRATAVDPRTRGRLDSRGETTLSFQMPSAVTLIGRTIYSRALVEDPAKPGEVLTMSSLGVTTITP